MDLGNLEDSLLNMAKEKGKEMADGVLEQHEGEGGIAGTVAGMGQEMLDKTLGGSEQADPGDNSGQDAQSSSDDDSNDDDNSDDDNADNK